MPKNNYQAYKAAINAAFASNAANPGVCYSDSRGWFTESLIHPADPDSRCRILASVNPDSGAWSLSRKPGAWHDVCEVFEIEML